MRAWAWAVPSVVAVLAGLPSLVYPHGRDQGSYTYAGWRLLEGELPYRDVISFKPPGTVLVHAAAVGLFGVNDVAIRAFDLAWQAAASLALVGLALSLGARPGAALLAGMISPLLYWQLDYWNVAQTDGWVNLPATLALWGTLAAFQAPPRRAALAWVACGAAVGFAVSLKYTALGVAAPIGVALAIGARGAWRDAARGLGWGVAGLLAVVAGAGIALVATGSWSAFAEIQFELVPGYVADRRKGTDVIDALLRSVAFTGHRADVSPLFVAGPVGALLAWGRVDRRAWALLVGWWMVGFLGVHAQGKFYDYHYLPLLAPSALLAGIGVDRLRERLAGAVGPTGAHAAIALVAALGLAVSPLATYTTEALSVATGQRARVRLWADEKRYNYRDYDCAEAEAAGRWLAQNTAPDDPVFAWTYDPAILVRARRRQVSRFLYNYPLRVAWRDPRWEDEILAALEADPPAAIVIATRDVVFGVSGNHDDSLKALSTLPRLNARLAEGWCPAARVGRYRMWLPRDQGC